MGDKKENKKLFEELDKPFKRHMAYVTEKLFSDSSVFVDPSLSETYSERAFDSYHYDYYHDRLKEPTIKNARDQMVWNHLAMKQARGGVDALYVPTAITGGIRADMLAIETDHRLPVQIGSQKLLLRNSHDLGKSDAGSQRMFEDVVQPNERDAMGRVTELSRKFPEYCLLFPFDKEGAVHQNRMDQDSSFGRQPEQEDFMGGWYTEVDDDLTVGVIYERDIPFSRNSNWENMRGVANSIGMFTGVTRGNVDFKFFRGDRSYSTLAERIQSTAEYLVFALKNEFYAEEAATSLAWMLEIDERLRNPDYNAKSYQPINREDISSQLRDEYFSDEKWARDSLAKTDSIRPLAEKLLKGYFVGHIKEEYMAPLNKSYHKARKNLPAIDIDESSVKRGYARPKPKSLDQRLKSLKISPSGELISAIKDKISDFESVDRYRLVKQPHNDNAPKSLRQIATPHFEGRKDLVQKGAHMVHTVKQINHNQDVFDAVSFGSKVFDRNYFSRIKSKREQIAVKMAIGAMMTITPPYARPAWTFVSSDFKKGRHGQKAMENKGLADINDLEGAYKDQNKFRNDVVVPAIKDCLAGIEREREEQLEDCNFAGPVMSSVDTDYVMTKAYEQLPNITAVKGPPKLSSEAKMAMRIAILDLMADTLRLADDDWANSEKQVNHVTRATLSQLGLTNRGYMHPYNMVIKNADGEAMNLHERVKPIADYVEYSVNNGIRSSEQALAAFTMIQLHEMLIDPEYNKDRQGRTIIDFNNVHESFANYRYSPEREEMEKLIYGDKDGRTDLEKKGLRAYLRENCADWLDYPDVSDDLDSDIYRSWKELQGDKDYDLRRETPQTRLGVRGAPKPK